MVACESPPMLRSLTAREVDAWAAKEAPQKYPLLKIPCHLQTVERHAMLVSEAPRKSCSIEELDGMIRATKSPRAKIPRFGSKEDYGFLIKMFPRKFVNTVKSSIKLHQERSKFERNLNL